MQTNRSIEFDPTGPMSAIFRPAKNSNSPIDFQVVKNRSDRGLCVGIFWRAYNRREEKEERKQKGNFYERRKGEAAGDT